jgi:hypothetical protein
VVFSLGSVNVVKVWFIRILQLSSTRGPVYAVILVGLVDACGGEKFVCEWRPCGILGIIIIIII